MFELSAHGADVHVGTGPRYPWGGLYGGQIVAQALRASTISVDPELEPHSIRAYFIRRGDHTEPVRYEVDRIRNGRSFATRRVVARQAVGAILNAESSFQRPEPAPSIQPVPMPQVPGPDGLGGEPFLDAFDRAEVPDEAVASPDAGRRDGFGRTIVWMKARAPLGDPTDPEQQLLHRCWLAYMSDDVPTETVIRSHPDAAAIRAEDAFFCASLDHTIWFHRSLSADRWHLYDFTCHHYVGARGLSVGHVFREDGVHVATVAQEVLVRDGRDHHT